MNYLHTKTRCIGYSAETKDQYRTNAAPQDGGEIDLEYEIAL